MKVLVTSSTGLTGKAVTKALTSKNIEVRAMIHSPQKADEMRQLGARDICIGDIADYNDFLFALKGVDAIYYICPTAREDEAQIGKMAVSVAQKLGVKRFVYQSVLHSIDSDLPHHCQKLEIEQALIDSRLNYSIVQPAPFMQNIFNTKNALLGNKLFVQKFFTGYDSTNRINLLDADDFGQCVAEIFMDKRLEYSTVELCGPQNLSVADMISAMEKVCGEKIALKYITDEELRVSMSDRNISEYYIETLLRMFHHYNEGDFCGSDFVCSSILKRAPLTFLQFLKRELL